MVTRIMTLFTLITLCAMPCMAKTIKGNGKITTKQISIGEYSSVLLSSNTLGSNNSWFNWFSSGQQTSYIFNYKQGETASLQIIIDENLYPYLNIKTNNEELTITTKGGEELIPTTFKLNGTSKNLKKIHTSGNIDFALQNPLSGDDLEILTTKGSDITMEYPVQMNHCTVTARAGGDIVLSNLTCESIQCKATSGSDLTLKGKANSALYEASSGSDIKGSDFIIARLECSASSGSDIYTHVTDYLKASASGGSDIHYKGNPKLNSSASGGSNITKEGN